jgi:hypothetical protein
MGFWGRARKIIKGVASFLEALYQLQSTEAAERRFQQTIEKPPPGRVDEEKESNS